MADRVAEEPHDADRIRPSSFEPLSCRSADLRSNLRLDAGRQPFCVACASACVPIDPRRNRKSSLMYDMYPEWGPAQHDEDHPANPANWSSRSATMTAPVQESIDLRDNGGERPDDN